MTQLDYECTYTKSNTYLQQALNKNNIIKISENHNKQKKKLTKIPSANFKCECVKTANCKCDVQMGCELIFTRRVFATIIIAAVEDGDDGRDLGSITLLTI